MTLAEPGLPASLLLGPGGRVVGQGHLDIRESGSPWRGVFTFETLNGTLEDLAKDDKVGFRLTTAEDQKPLPAVIVEIKRMSLTVSGIGVLPPGIEAST